jgi:hypothetical protein
VLQVGGVSQGWCSQAGSKRPPPVRHLCATLLLDRPQHVSKQTPGLKSVSAATPACIARQISSKPCCLQVIAHCGAAACIPVNFSLACNIKPNGADYTAAECCPLPLPLLLLLLPLLLLPRWPEDLPPGSVVVLSGKDDLVDSGAVRAMLEQAGHVQVSTVGHNSSRAVHCLFSCLCTRGQREGSMTHQQRAKAGLQEHCYLACRLRAPVMEPCRAARTMPPKNSAAQRPTC